MKLSLNIKTSLQQTLTPQQIQYLKLLQLTTTQLEQHIREEIEANPLLEEIGHDTPSSDSAPENDNSFPSEDLNNDLSADFPDDAQGYIGDSPDPFEFYKLVWQDDSDTPDTRGNSGTNDEDGGEPFQIKDNISLLEDLLRQISFLPVSAEEKIIAKFVLGSINESGYLIASQKDNTAEENFYKDNLADCSSIEEEITTQVNDEIDELNNNIMKESDNQTDSKKINPARQFDISPETKNIINRHFSTANLVFPAESGNDTQRKNPANENLLKHVNTEDTEKVIKLIQHLDPPGIASRNIRECLLAQLEVLPKLNASQKLAYHILKDAYGSFSKKHFDEVARQLGVEQDYLKEGIDEIKKLNPKPAGGDFAHETNTVTPDFLVSKDESTGELLITVNDNRLPTLKVNDTYNKIRQDAKFQKTKSIPSQESSKQSNFNRETINWIREKYDDAQFLIQAIKQRKNTMLKVMTAIAYRQKTFFKTGKGIKPLIYKIVAEDTGLDISTVCRIVNGKYCQTEYGTFELRYFFSESLLNDDGEEISTRAIKEILKSLIDSEDKSNPLSDDKLMQMLKSKGYNVARRTVAKYRDQLKIPVARMRKEL